MPDAFRETEAVESRRTRLLDGTAPHRASDVSTRRSSVWTRQHPANHD